MISAPLKGIASVTALVFAAWNVAAQGDVKTINAKYETKGYFDAEFDFDADPDDPAICIHPNDKSKSLVITSLKNGSVVRVVELDPASGKSVAQYAYTLPPVPVDKAPSGTFTPDNGLPELLALSNNEFVAVERAFADGVGNTIRLVLAIIEADTTNVQPLKSLQGVSYKPMKKQLLLEMPITYQGVKIDNIEGATWGPRLPNGNRTLVLVADNNFADNQVTQFLAFEVLP